MALPDPEQWVLDNRKDTVNSGFRFNNASGLPRVEILLNGLSQCNDASSSAFVRCPMAYRRLPPSPSVSVDMDMSATVGAQPSALAGIVVFNARTNAPLLSCGLESTGSTIQFGLKSQNTYRGSGPFSGSDATGNWNNGVVTLQLQHTTGQTTNGWTCAARVNGLPSSWAAVTTRAQASDSQLDGFQEGDLYYGLVAQVSGEGSG